MMTAARLIKYLDINGLPVMALLAVLPTLELQSGSMSLSVTHTHTHKHRHAHTESTELQIHHKNQEVMELPPALAWPGAV